MNTDLITVANPLAQYRSMRDDLRIAMDRVLEGGFYILGPEVAAFEQEFAAYTGVDHCLGVANGTDALVVALKGCGVQPGDEVITVSQTAVATVAAIEMAGAVPVFADIDPLTRCMSPEHLPALLSAKTRAVLPVHLYGQPAPMDEICRFAKEHGLLVIEDCAQAHGAMIGDQRVGTFGDAATFSFYPTKNLGAIGDGGAVVTGNAEIAENCRLLRQYGWKERYISHVAGMNSRLDELQAAILRVKLARLDEGNAARRSIAAAYNEAVNRHVMTPPPLISGTTPVFHLYVVQCLLERDTISAKLAQAGIATAIHYPQPVHMQPAYLGRCRGADRLPVTESLTARILSLPMYPELEQEQVERVCSALNSW
jgi:dTDP-4-amino-4,6-dideoxygalactose transaminase